MGNEQQYFDEYLESYSLKNNSLNLAQTFLNIEKANNSSEPYWNEETYQTHLKSRDRVFGLIEKDKLKGFIFYKFIDHDLEITHWSVAEKGSGQGKLFFKEFMAQVGKKAQKIILECGEFNLAAHTIYKSFCFDKTGFRPSYYKSGEGAWIMERRLES